MSIPSYKKYQEIISHKLQLAFGQEEQIQQPAGYLASTLTHQGWVYSFGTGHSHMIAEELFYRAGGFARVRALLVPELMLHQSATGSTEAERKEGYARHLLKDYVLGPQDVLIIASNSGRNAVPIELAQLAKDKGAKVIVLTNLRHSKSVSSRHSSGLKLYQLGDVVLDNMGEIGDAALALEGLETKVGPTSTVVSTALLQAICVEATSTILAKGGHPEVFNSSNSDQGSAHNEVLIEEYKKWVSML